MWTSVCEIKEWKDRGGVRDDDGVIFAMFNSPLSKRAGERQTVMKIMYYLLLGVVADIDR